MNLYEHILQVSNCIKQKQEVKELIKIYNEIKDLKKDIKYSFFFSIIDGKEFYNFFAPNISMQIISNVYKNNDFNIIPKEVCELIINNRSINKYIQISTKVNEIIIKEIMSFFNPQEFEEDFKIKYEYNRLSEKLGYIGFIENLKIMTGKGKELEMYFKKRNLLIEEGLKVFPINKFDDEFFNEIYKLGISKETVDSIEKFNLILYIIERIIYCNIYDKIIVIKNENIKVINEKEKLNMIYKEMVISNNELLLKNFPILILEEDYYFLYSKKIEFRDQNITIQVKSFSCKLNERNELGKLSIIDTVELFKDI